MTPAEVFTSMYIKQEPPMMGWPPAKRQRCMPMVPVPMPVMSAFAAAVPQPTGVGEVRFETAAAASRAVETMNGSVLNGTQLRVVLDGSSKDGSKILVMGVPLGVEWQELKDHFSAIGELAFVSLKPAKYDGRMQMQMPAAAMYQQQQQQQQQRPVAAGQAPAASPRQQPSQQPQQAQKPASSGLPATAEVRFDCAQAAARAVDSLDGSDLGSGQIRVSVDPASQDKTKLVVSGLPPGTAWQELKEHFAQLGSPVAFAQVKDGSGSLTGEVRYDNAAVAAQALLMLDGSRMGNGGPLRVMLDPTSQDRTKLVVSGLPPGTSWQELKDHFAELGSPVAFAQVNNSSQLAACEGEVRYDNQSHAGLAVMSLNGSALRGNQIQVALSPGSIDGSKLIVRGLAPDTLWQELKDHFSKVGQVAFAQVNSQPKGNSSSLSMGSGCAMGPAMAMGFPMKGKGKGFAGGIPMCFPMKGMAMMGY